jgi:hypothetical protein
MKALTRKEIVEIWEGGTEENLNSYCCPDCRDLLTKCSGTLFCDNDQCLNNQQFEPETGEEIDD